MRSGIDDLDLYVGRLSTSALAIAVARGKEAAYAESSVMVGTRTVLPPWEDAVTLAVNAGKRLLARLPASTRAEIGLVVVGTESAVDHGKPIATWVHRFLELPSETRAFEVKHACYGGTAALKTALGMVAAGFVPGKRALVLSADATRPGLRKNDGYDFIGGGCATAMLVGGDAGILEIEPGRAGYFTNEVADTFRPTGREEIADNETSLYSYLDALDGSYAHFAAGVGAMQLEDYRYHIYHAPFPGLTLQAHRTLLANLGVDDKKAARASFDTKVAPTIRLARRIGSAYGASNFVCLASLLANAEVTAGDRITLFSYGSGSQGELYDARIGSAPERVRARAITEHEAERQDVTLERYERYESLRDAGVEQESFTPERDECYRDAYAGRGLLVLRNVEAYRRHYEWS